MNWILSHSTGSAKRKIRETSEVEKRRFISVFHDCDEDKKGYLSRQDLKVAMVILFGYKPSKYEVDQMMSGSTSSEGVMQDHFMSTMESKMAAQDLDEEIRQTFMTFDTHCRGFITLEDLYKAFNEVAPHTPRHRIDSLYREIDRDGDGRVSYRDFEFMMKFRLADGF
ncbi:EF-hand calcium-binding domain-containing protein 11-like [Asterias amurensis]|uniref:EF-hand calcium-binding domain-containing protein 11-like n=1 Tax=Asterias amurensis TaxID=7602 RepID=UPI003AB41B31